MLLVASKLQLNELVNWSAINYYKANLQKCFYCDFEEIFF